MTDIMITCKDALGNPHEVPVAALTFRPGAYAVIIQNGKILLSKQSEGYDFPGGGIKIDESIEQALVREVKEETGFDVKVGRLVDCQDNFYKSHRTDTCFHSILIYYLCEITGGKLSIEGLTENEKTFVEMPEWISLESINETPFYNTANSLTIIDKAFGML